MHRRGLGTHSVPCPAPCYRHAMPPPGLPHIESFFEPPLNIQLSTLIWKLRRIQGQREYGERRVLPSNKWIIARKYQTAFGIYTCNIIIISDFKRLWPRFCHFIMNMSVIIIPLKKFDIIIEEACQDWVDMSKYQPLITCQICLSVPVLVLLVVEYAIFVWLSYSYVYTWGLTLDFRHCKLAHKATVSANYSLPNLIVQEI